MPPRVHDAQVALVLASMPLKDVRGLGGQLGERVGAMLGVQYAGELAAVPVARLEGCFGAETARWLAAVGDG